MYIFTGSGPNTNKPVPFSLVLCASPELNTTGHIPYTEYNFAFLTAVTVLKSVKLYMWFRNGECGLGKG